MGDKSGLAWPQIVSQSYTFCSPMPIVGVDLEGTKVYKAGKEQIENGTWDERQFER